MRASCFASRGLLGAALFLTQGLAAQLDSETQSNSAGAASSWRFGPAQDKFPIAVWLQSPANAARFKAAGINLYVGLWRGPTDQQLDALRAADMPVICAQNELALARKHDPIIVGWMHGDEPDNAQSLPGGRGYGPPISPAVIERDYHRMRAADRDRPVLLNLGQGVAWDNYIGRGVRRNRPEDYPEYLRGCDIGSFDIYPVVHDHSDIAGKLEYVAYGVKRLRAWAGPRTLVWNCIECTHISNPERKATPEQVKAEVWMSLIHGSQGLIYFVHQFKPVFKEAALLDDPVMLAAVTRINSQIQALASVLRSASLESGLQVRSLNPETGEPVPASGLIGSTIAWMHKQHDSHRFVFAVNLRNSPVQGVFTLDNGRSNEVVVMGEDRLLPVKAGEFTDHFEPSAVHLYRLTNR